MQEAAAAASLRIAKTVREIKSAARRDIWRTFDAFLQRNGVVVINGV